MKQKITKIALIVSTMLLSTSCANFLSALNNIFNESSGEPTIIAGNGFYKPSKMSFKANDVDNSYCPSTGSIKLLIIPIKFPSSIGVTTTIEEQIINERYFGKSDTSLKNYYANASMGKLTLSGTIAPTYSTSISPVTLNRYSEEQFANFLMKAYEHSVTEGNINLSEYDSNKDGRVDAVHFITNLSTQAYEYKIDSSGLLWPHMWYLNNEAGTPSKPVPNVYLCAPFGMIGDTTIIHEQGHVFGLEDYYNYTESSYADYVGGFDMQNLNVGDWNPFSKMLMNWIQPYVIDGTEDEVNLTIKPSAKSGECILIPAVHDKWNGSAYDEYILLELFTKNGNNAIGWDNWTNIANSYGSIKAGSLNNGGVRMYHVDSRLYGFNEYEQRGDIVTISRGEYVSSPFNSDYTYGIVPATNSKNNYDYSGINVTSAANFKLLSVIQAGKTNTFKSGVTRNALNQSDLFQTGDEFKLSSYKNFFIDEHMNSGLTFPYKIIFNSVTKTEANITISKI